MGNPPAASEAIAAELRAAIATGKLGVGDRVPSTRAITRRWGVAMATATKALARLRAEGLTEVRVGVGTVVKSPDPAAAGPDGGTVSGRVARAGDTGLSTPALVAAATRIADTEGLAAMSMRRVAAELGVATMSLYRYVGDKDELVVAMMEAALGEWQPDDRPTVEPRAAIESLAEALWATFRRHPWLAPAMSATRPQLLVNGFRFSDRLLSALRTVQPDPAAAFTSYLVIFNYVRGIGVNLEPERLAEADTGLTADEWMDTRAAELQAMVAERDVPVFAAHLGQLMETGYDFDLDHLFRTGLGYLLDGLLVLAPGGSSRVPRRPGACIARPTREG
jgi:AcrR family transcriptional regulator